MAAKQVSFIIIHYNNFEYLHRCLFSILERIDLSPDEYEVIIVDNGSSDGACEWVKNRYPEIKIVSIGNNLGFAKAVNRGAQSASGLFLAVVNNDVEFNETSSVRRMLEACRQDLRTGMLCVQLLNTDLSRQSSYTLFPSFWGELSNKSLMRRIAAVPRIGDRPIEVEAAVGAFMLISRKAFEELGGFDEAYFFFMEETDFCLRLRQKEWKTVFLPASMLIHHQGRTANRRPLRARIEFYISRYLYYKKHFAFLLRLALRAALLLKLGVNFLSFLLVTLATLGLKPELRRKTWLYGGLLFWHFIFCPKFMGLRPR